MICGIHTQIIYFFVYTVMISIQLIKSRRAGVSFNDDERSGGKSGGQSG
jgi:hypothetical protein